MAVIEMNKEKFDKEVLQSKDIVLVDFNANWCGPCQMLKPILEEVSNEKQDVKFVSVNIDDEDELAEEYEVFSIPCLVVFKDGKEVKRNVGFVPKEEIEKLIGE